MYGTSYTGLYILNDINSQLIINLKRSKLFTLSIIVVKIHIKSVKIYVNIKFLCIWFLRPRKPLQEKNNRSTNLRNLLVNLGNIDNII